MIPTRNSDGAARTASRGFTLMEVVLVMVMMVLILGAVSLWVQQSVLNTAVRTPDEVFYIAAAEARILALNEGKPVQLSFDPQAQGFRLKVIDGASTLNEAVLEWDEPLPWENLERSSRWRRASGTASDGTENSGTSLAATGSGGARFFPFGAGEYRVTFYGLYGEDSARLEPALDVVVYHPSGASTPVEVVLEDRSGTGYTQLLRPDNFANGPRLADGIANGGSSAAGGWR